MNVWAHDIALSLILPRFIGERLLTLCMALIADALLGELPASFKLVPHPVVIMGGAIGFLERRLNRPSRGRMDRRIRGILTLIILAGAAATFGFAISVAAGRFRFGWLIEMALTAILLAQRSLYDHVAAVGQTLQTGGLNAGRQTVARIVGRDPDSLDVHGVARAAVESLAENFSDGVVAPALAYAALGLPGILLYKMANTLDSMIGHRSARYREFGWSSARFDDLLNLIPARLSGLLICLAAAFAPGASPFRAFATMLRDAGKHRSPNAGWPEAAMAGALGAALAGPRRYGEVKTDDPWLGNGAAKLTVSDIRRALVIYVAACLLLLGGLAVSAAVLMRR